MKPALRFALIAAIILAAASTAGAQGSWVGESVFYTKPQKEIKFGAVVDGKQVYFPLSSLVPVKVRAERDGWMRIFDGYREGWIDKADLVLARDAQAYFHRRVLADPRDTFALLMRGEGWRQQGELDKAIKDFDECIRLNPADSIAYNNRGTAWGSKKDYDKAIADFNQAIRLDPKLAHVFYNRGNAWIGKKDYPKAIADYSETIALDPKNASAYNNRAWLWATLPDAKYRDGKKAVESAKMAMALDPKNANRMSTLAAAYAEIGDFAEAVRWQEMLLADPQFRNSERARGRLELYRDKKPLRQE